jgi:hypothetical protein
VPEQELVNVTRPLGDKDGPRNNRGPPGLHDFFKMKLERTLRRGTTGTARLGGVHAFQSRSVQIGTAIGMECYEVFMPSVDCSKHAKAIKCACSCMFRDARACGMT